MSPDDTLDPLAFSLRAVVPNDIPFIVKAWMGKVRHSPFTRHIPNPIFTIEHHKLIERLLKRSYVLVACNPSDPDHIFAFLVWEPEPLYLHFLFVKPVFRKLGLARHLLQQAVPDLFTPDAPELRCSHATEVFNPLPVLNSDGQKTGEEIPNPTVQRYRLVFDPYPALKG